jgi:hypothetical protein
MGTGGVAYQQCPGATSETVDGEAVIVDPAGTELITLNPVGSLVWNELREPHETPELVAIVSEHFADVARDVLERDIAAFVQELRDAGLVIDAPAPG